MYLSTSRIVKTEGNRDWLRIRTGSDGDFNMHTDGGLIRFTRDEAIQLYDALGVWLQETRINDAN